MNFSKKNWFFSFFMFIYFFAPTFVSAGNVYDISGIPVEIIDTDITKLAVDAIVNPANKTLLKQPGGVAGAIWAAAGAKKINEFIEKAFSPKQENDIKIELGQAIITPSFDLEKQGIKYIIHTVGPNCKINEPIGKLYDSYKNSLLLAGKYKLETIAFPAISTGIFECDKKKCAELAIKAIQDIASTTCLRKIYLVTYMDPDQFFLA